MRTRSLSLGTLAAAAFMGCAAGPRVEDVEPRGPPAMRVWIGYPIGRSSVFPIFVNQAAHVAVFEIVPGRGVAMLYPRSGADVFASDAHYADLAFQLGRGLYQSDPFGLASFQPRYYYAVASAAPLHLSRLLSSLSTMRRVLGREYASYRPYDVIDRLTHYIVPKQMDEDWATDLFVAWPMAPALPPIFASRIVTCANGRVIEVPASYPYYGCPGDAGPAVVATAAKPPIEQLSADSLSRPRLPKIRDGQRTAESQGSAVVRRRAEAGAPRSYPRGLARSPSTGSGHYVETGFGRSTNDRESARSVRESSSTSSSRAEPARAGPERSRPVEREPRSEPPPRGGSETERKPR